MNGALCLLALAGALGFEIQDAYRAQVPGEVADQPWWSRFEDPNLARLVEEALAGNHDLEASAGRILQAEALADQAKAFYFPILTGNVTANLTPSAVLGFQFGGFPAGQRPDVLINGSATVNLQYSIDGVFRGLLLARAADLQTDASRDERDAFAMGLAANVAGAYLDAVAAVEQRVAIDEQIRANESLLELTKLRFDRGEATALEVLQQRQQTAAAKSRLPNARAQERVQAQRLLVLLGRPTNADLPTIAKALPTLPARPATGSPQDLIAHRPDLRSSRSRVTSLEDLSANAVLGHAPRLGVNAQAGIQFRDLGEFDTAETWGAGATLTIPIFSGGADAAAVREARANEVAARRSLQQAVLRAVAEVETAMIQEEEQSAALEALDAQKKAAAQALEESKARYVAGLTNYLSVLTALNGLHASELAIVAARRALLATRIQLQQALGGPWTKNLGVRR